MKPMSEKQLVYWEKQRTNGRWAYIFKNMVNCTVAAVFSSYLVASVFGYRSYKLLWFTPLYVIVGLLAGIAGWLSNEDKYEQYLIEKRIGKRLEF
jgi:hypothetical protein